MTQEVAKPFADAGHLLLTGHCAEAVREVEQAYPGCLTPPGPTGTPATEGFG